LRLCAFAVQISLWLKIMLSIINRNQKLAYLSLKTSALEKEDPPHYYSPNILKYFIKRTAEVYAGKWL